MQHPGSERAQLANMLRLKTRSMPGQVEQVPGSARVQGSQVLRQVQPGDGKQVCLVHVERGRKASRLVLLRRRAGEQGPQHAFRDARLHGQLASALATEFHQPRQDHVKARTFRYRPSLDD